MGELELAYWLPTTFVTFTGTRTSQVSGADPDYAVTQATASTDLRADLKFGGPLSLTVNEKSLDQTNAVLSFSDDGRLQSTEIETTSSVPQLLGTVVSLGAGIAGLVLPLTATPLLTRTASPAPDHAEFPDAERLRKFRSTVTQLQEQLNTVAASLAESSTDAGAAWTKLSTLQLALVAVRSEIAQLETAQQAWQAKQFPSTVESLTFCLDVAELPTESELSSPNPGSEDDEKPWMAVWDELGLMTTIESSGPSAHLSTASLETMQQESAGRVWFRRARRVRTTLWKKSAGGVPEKTRVVPTDILDRFGSVEHLDFEKGGWFGHKDVAVTFGPLGTPVRVSANTDSGASALAAALGKAPDAVAGAFTDASTISTSWQTLAGIPAAQHLAALAYEQNVLEAEKAITALQQGTGAAGA